MLTKFNPVMTNAHHAPADATLQIANSLDRAAFGPPDHIAPSARTCLLVRPAVLTETFAGLFASGWRASAKPDSYSRYIGDNLVHISLEGGVWMIEAAFPASRQPPVVLGLGCSLIVTESPMAAAHLAKVCAPKAVPPFQWVSYW